MRQASTAGYRTQGPGDAGRASSRGPRHSGPLAEASHSGVRTVVGVLDSSADFEQVGAGCGRSPALHCAKDEGAAQRCE
jgi:hypothetical protein